MPKRSRGFIFAAASALTVLLLTAAPALAHDHILVIGVIVQVSVAIVAAGVLWLLATTSSRLAATSVIHARLPRHRSVLALPLTVRPPHALLFATAGSIRAPPSS